MMLSAFGAKIQLSLNSKFETNTRKLPDFLGKLHRIDSKLYSVSCRLFRASAVCFSVQCFALLLVLSAVLNIKRQEHCNSLVSVAPE